MTYPQPSADQAVLDGQGYFRLNTPLQSPGDIYESKQGCHAICVGPDSDIARVGVAYWDALRKPTFVNQFLISPDRAFVGFIANRLETYQPAGVLGRIMFYSSDLYDPNYFPTFGDKNTDAIVHIEPVLDVIQYFTPQVSLTPKRVDKEFYFQEPPHGVSGGNMNQKSYTVIPYYGRSFAAVELQNYTGKSANFLLYGVNFAITDDNANPIHQEFSLVAWTAVASGATFKYMVRADVDGMFDALVIGTQLDATATSSQIPVNIRMSDNPQ